MIELYHFLLGYYKKKNSVCVIITVRLGENRVRTEFGGVKHEFTGDCSEEIQQKAWRVFQ